MTAQGATPFSTLRYGRSTTFWETTTGLIQMYRASPSIADHPMVIALRENA